jgi:tight adherence protein B
MPTIIEILVFLTVFVFTLSLHLLRQDMKRRKKEKLIASLAAFALSGSGAKAERANEGPLEGSRLHRIFSRRIDLRGLDSLIRAAQAPISVERFFLLSALAGFFFMLIPLVFFRHPAVIMLAAAAGLCLPTGILRVMRARREEALVQQLPEAIDSIVRSLRAGQSVDSAIEEVIGGFPPPIGAEFRSIREEVSMGLPFEIALNHFQRRFPRVVDVKILCVAFIIQRETGGNLTEILAGLSSTIRERFRLKRKVKAATAEGRMTAVILGCLPAVFAGVTWLIKPDYVGVLLHHPTGKKLLLAVIILELIGFILMRTLTRVET